jgi:hypothetical protein
MDNVQNLSYNYYHMPSSESFRKLHKVSACCSYWDWRIVTHLSLSRPQTDLVTWRMSHRDSSWLLQIQCSLLLCRCVRLSCYTIFNVQYLPKYKTRSFPYSSSEKWGGECLMLNVVCVGIFLKIKDCEGGWSYVQGHISVNTIGIPWLTHFINFELMQFHMNIHSHLIISAKIQNKFNYLSKNFYLIMLLALCSI